MILNILKLFLVVVIFSNIFIMYTGEDVLDQKDKTMVFSYLYRKYSKYPKKKKKNVNIRLSL